jgi:hypothetical protein
LQIHINHLPILVNCPPQIVLFTIDLYDDLIDVEGIAIAAMVSLQTPGIFGAKLGAPKSDCLVTDSDAALRKQILNIAVAEVESVVEPDCLADDIWRESVPFVSIHPPIPANLGS